MSTAADAKAAKFDAVSAVQAQSQANRTQAAPYVFRLIFMLSLLMFATALCAELVERLRSHLHRRSLLCQLQTFRQASERASKERIWCQQFSNGSMVVMRCVSELEPVDKFRHFGTLLSGLCLRNVQWLVSQNSHAPIRK